MTCIQVLSSNLDKIILTKTWLSPSIKSNILCIPGYTIIHRDRNQHGGGILFYFGNKLPIANVTSNLNIELQTVLRPTLDKVLYPFYRPPSAPPSFLNELDLALTTLPSTKQKSAIMLGDFNVNLLSDLTHLSLFCNM